MGWTFGGSVTRRSITGVRRSPFLIGVDGLAGSGKTTLAHALAEEMGAQIVQLDDFSSWEGDRWTAADVARVRREVMDPLSAGQPARYQRYDWHRRGPGEWFEVEARGTIIIEGVRALHSTLADGYGLRIWVECPRGLRRGRGRNRDGESTSAQWELWMADEDQYMATERPADRADAIVDGRDRTRLLHGISSPSQQ